MPVRHNVTYVPDAQIVVKPIEESLELYQELEESAAGMSPYERTGGRKTAKEREEAKTECVRILNEFGFSIKSDHNDYMLHVENASLQHLFADGNPYWFFYTMEECIFYAMKILEARFPERGKPFKIPMTHFSVKRRYKHHPMWGHKQRNF